MDLGEGTARYRMRDVQMQDYKTLLNALFSTGEAGFPKPSTVSWDLRFRGVTARTKVSDAAVGFGGVFLSTNAHIDWSMTEAGFSFHTNAAGQTVLVAFIGRERNGVFFARHGEDNNSE